MTDFDRDRLSRIDGWMQSYVDRGRYPGSTFLLAKGGDVVHRFSCGEREVGAGRAFEEDTIVRIFSMTKPVTSVALMMLVERGEIHLDSPVSDFIPEFGECRALTGDAKTVDDTVPCSGPTLHQLATHTAGLTYGFNPGVLGKHYAEQKLGFDPGGPGLEEAARRVAAAPLAFIPGARWEYSVATDVLGRVVEVVSGKPLDRFFAEEILEPLRMSDTFFRIPDDKVDRLAHLYTSLDGPMSLAHRGGGVMKLAETAEDSAWRRTRTHSGGGGLLSTVDDFFHFAEMLRRDGEFDGVRLLSPSTVRFMKRNHLEGDIASMGPKSFAELPMTGVGFGIGGSVVLDPALMRVPGSVGDFSWGGVASTIFWIDPETEITCIFFTQLTPSSSYPSRSELKALVHGAMA